MIDIISFIISPPPSTILVISKLVFILVSLFLTIGLIFFLMKNDWLNFLILQDSAEFLTFRPFGVKKIVKVWDKITVKLDTGLESEYKLAVIEADDMMNDILKRMGITGETLGEKLKNLTSATLPNIEEIIESHQVRNNIVHNPDYELSLDEAKKLLAVYEKAFQNLQAF